MKINADLAMVQKQFADFYRQNLQQIYTQLEPVRYEYLHILYKRLFYTALGAGAFWLCCHMGWLNGDSGFSGILMTIFIVAAVLDFFVLQYPFQTYRERTKARVMQKILSFWGQFDYCRKKQIISTETIKSSEIFMYFNREEVDDSFCGTYKGIGISVSEHNLRIHGSKGDTNIFNGVFILLNFPKNFNTTAVVLSRKRFLKLLCYNPVLIMPLLLIPITAIISILISLLKYRIGDFSAILDTLMPLAELVPTLCIVYLVFRILHRKIATQKTELEGIPFMRMWKVKTNNQIEARCILTPLLMQNMLKIKKLFYGHAIDFSFFGNKLLIAVHTRKNLFETTSLFTSALSYHKMREVVSQLHSIFSVIDMLELPKKKLTE